ncbi:MAG: hypothetical protein LBS62_14715 [Clostridiales bacterium]|jgi:hypothetical protein|nr:hypothetical protein [Clostridiales bacterium]
MRLNVRVILIAAMVALIFVVLPLARESIITSFGIGVIVYDRIRIFLFASFGVLIISMLTGDYFKARRRRRALRAENQARTPDKPRTAPGRPEVDRRDPRSIKVMLKYYAENNPELAEMFEDALAQMSRIDHRQEQLEKVKNLLKYDRAQVIGLEQDLQEVEYEIWDNLAEMQHWAEYYMAAEANEVAYLQTSRLGVQKLYEANVKILDDCKKILDELDARIRGESGKDASTVISTAEVALKALGTRKYL